MASTTAASTASARTRLARRLLVAALAVGALVGLPTAALADISGPCTGFADFADGHWTPDNDSADNPIVIPPDQDVFTVHYFGESAFDNNHHSGRVYAAIGPAGITIGQAWSDTNGDDPNEQGHEGTTTIDLSALRDKVDLRGLVPVSGNHSADGGSCSGNVMLKFDGPVFDSMIAVAAAGGMGTMALLLVVSALASAGAAAKGASRGHPILGSISGLLLGFFLAVMLQQASIAPLTNATLFGLPALLLLVGLGLGLWGPLGQARLAGSIASASSGGSAGGAAGGGDGPAEAP